MVDKIMNKRMNHLTGKLATMTISFYDYIQINNVKLIIKNDINSLLIHTSQNNICIIGLHTSQLHRINLTETLFTYTGITSFIRTVKGVHYYTVE